MVKNTKVPLLPGEDLQTIYDLRISRQASGHSEIRVGNTDRAIAASSAQGVDLGFEIRQAYTTQSFIRRKAVQRNKAKSQNNNSTPLLVTAAADVLIAAESVHSVPVNAQMDGRDDWIVEKVVIGSDDTHVMAAPTTWISSKCPYLPIANPSGHPRYIRTGEVLGYLMDPEGFADKPSTDESWAQHVASAEAMKSVIQGTLRARELADPGLGTSTASDSKLEDEDSWGPKTTALPDATVEGDISDLVDLGPDILDSHWREFLERMQQPLVWGAASGRSPVKSEFL